MEYQEIQGTIFFEKVLPEKKNLETLETCSPVVKWDTVRSMLILLCILGLKSQSIDFTNEFSQAYIPIAEQVLIKLPIISRVVDDNVILL